ncbi:contractile injection system protein, VgrG/Pvc8 family [Planctobacterium marinum]|uniref:contractile injection system protein, VgrG/Pvc8 family n=1 Tax=Planctobacterium marinum TaxID=1631968 RepID=UPI001E33AC3E|nr:contractile injection system protein, VgrG/Pvc8 family [Planctobacterium marinum]MCC2604030.1 hypothetical protein [Planctobacterium marinum]
MRYNTGTNTTQIAEKVGYTDYPGTSRSDTPPSPRCSLDFYLELDDGTIIDDQTLRLQNFSGQESLSQMFDFNLNLRANTFFSSGINKPWGKELAGKYGTLLSEGGATSQTLDFQKILGAKACIRLGAPETEKDVFEGEYPEARPVVYFNGIITNFSMAERGVYSASLKPAVFKLSLQNNYRLFSQKTILEVIIEILSENSIDFNKDELEKKPSRVVRGLAGYRKQDWLQAGETDLDFLNRLMQKVSLFYYFEHSDKNHKMIITDQPYYTGIYARKVNSDGNVEETHDLKELYLSYTHQQTRERDDYITQFNYKQNLTTSGITTVLAQKEATWESQNTAMATPVFINKTNKKEKLNMEFLNMVQYGASEKEINTVTDNHMNRLVASRFDFSGSSTCPELKAGHKFVVKEKYDDDGSMPICPTLDGLEFVVTQVQHQGSAAGDYSNSFQAMDANGLASPFSAPHENQGSILALVVDNSGQTDYEGSSAKYLEKDGFAYDKKDFQFDDNGQQKFNCRGIYVTFVDDPDSVHWVKLAEHMQTIPETGAWVTVSRSQDNNEIPEVTQIMQNKGNKVIMPEDFTCSTNVGNNYSTSYGDNTSISFGANITTPLSKARTIVEKHRKSGNYNSVNYSESSSYGFSVTERSHSISRMGNGPDAGDNPGDMMSYVNYSDSSIYGNTYSKNLHIGKQESYSTQTGGSYSESTQTGGSVSVSTIDTTDSTSTVGTSTSVSTVGTSNSVSSVGTSNSTSTVGTSNSMSTTTMSNSISSTDMANGVGITTMSNNVSVTDMSNSVGIVSMSTSMNLTSISSSLNLTSMQSGLSLTGVSDNLSLTGASSQLSLTGSSSNLSLTGSSSSLGLTGSSSSLNLTGSSSSLNLTGSSASLNLTGESSSLNLTGSSTDLNITGGGATLTIDNRSTLSIEGAILEILSAAKLVL